MKGTSAVQMKHLPVGLEVKATDAGARTFEGVLSTSHLDLGDGWLRDIVWPGAFKRTLNAFKTAKDPYIPLVDTHQYRSAMNAYGYLLEAEEVLTGKTLEYELEPGGEVLKVPEMLLNTKWQVIEGQDGERVLDRLRGKAVRRMSMGHTPYKERYVTLKGYGRCRILNEVGLEEGSLTIFAMQPAATVDADSVKSLLAAMERGDLSDAEMDLIRALPDEAKTKFRALLDAVAPSPDGDTPAAPGLAPSEDSDAAALAAKRRSLTLRRLALAAQAHAHAVQ
jgi:hypothetical protein